VKITERNATTSAAASSPPMVVPFVCGLPSSVSPKEGELEGKKSERDAKRDDEIDNLGCNAIDEHTRRTRLAAVIAVASTALDVVSSDRAPYCMFNGRFASKDFISFSRRLAKALKDERCVELLGSLPPSLLWPGSGLIKALEDIHAHYCGVSKSKPVSEALYSSIKMIGTDKALITRLTAAAKGWSDERTRPTIPSEKECAGQWYRSHGYRGYHHFEKTGAANGYDSDCSVNYDGLSDDCGGDDCDDYF
jgi:hypothetical protein